MRYESELAGVRLSRDQYAMWSDSEVCVIARERVGEPEVSVVSVQFAPDYRRPSKGSMPKPQPHREDELELEVA